MEEGRWNLLDNENEGFVPVLAEQAQGLMQFGDGIFESIRVEGSNAPFFEDHWKRLIASARHFSFVLEDETLGTWKSHIQDLISRTSAPSRLKLILTRLGHQAYKPSNQHAIVLVTVKRLQGYDVTILSQLLLSEREQLLDPFISNHKTCNSLPYILASLEKTRRNSDGIILHHRDRGIIETDQSNIFFLRDGLCLTPKLDSGCLNGVCRKWIIHVLSNAFNVDVTESFVDPRIISEFNEVIISNAVQGPRNVASIDEVEFKGRYYGDELRKSFSQLFEK